jgi:hypothetical protein
MEHHFDRCSTEVPDQQKYPHQHPQKRHETLPPRTASPRFLYSYIVPFPNETESQADPVVDLELSHNPVRQFFWKHLVKPLLDLLRTGATPRRLAWSLAVGAALGINPILGISSLACLAAAFIFRLNVVATQIINHLVFPIQLALIVVFLGAGDRVFRTAAHEPMSRDAFTHAIHAHDWATAQLLWTWEWHALTVWLFCAVPLTPLVALALTPALEALLGSLKHQPIVEK